MLAATRHGKKSRTQPVTSTWAGKKQGSGLHHQLHPVRPNVSTLGLIAFTLHATAHPCEPRDAPWAAGSKVPRVPYSISDRV